MKPLHLVMLLCLLCMSHGCSKSTNTTQVTKGEWKSPRQLVEEAVIEFVARDGMFKSEEVMVMSSDLEDGYWLVRLNSNPPVPSGNFSYKVFFDGTIVEHNIFEEVEALLRKRQAEEQIE